MAKLKPITKIDPKNDPMLLSPCDPKKLVGTTKPAKKVMR